MEHRVSPGDPKLLMHPGGMSVIAAADLGLSELAIIGLHEFHQPFHPFLEGAGHPNAHNVWYGTQQGGSPPSAKYYPPLVGKFQNFLRRVQGKTFLVGGQPLDQPSLALAQAVDQTGWYVHFSGHMF